MNCVDIQGSSGLEHAAVSVCETSAGMARCIGVRQVGFGFDNLSANEALICPPQQGFANEFACYDISSPAKERRGKRKSLVDQSDTQQRKNLIISESQSYRARWILPIVSPPIHDGVITTRNGRIESISPFRNESNYTDLGDVVVLPRLVNAHTHLEFSDLSAPLGEPGISIADWIPLVIESRFEQNTDESARREAIFAGIDEVIAAGTSLVGEIASRPWPSDGVASRLRAIGPGGLAICAFYEVLGLSESRGQDVLNWADGQLQMPAEFGFTHGISPHAPYSCPVSLLGECVRRSKRLNIPLAMHVAESLEELELIVNGTGSLRDVFESIGLPNLEQFPTQESIADRIDMLGGSHHALIVHGNYLGDEEIEAIFRHRDSMTVVYCPRTHAYFGHSEHPVSKLLGRGIRVALGTDSRSSNPDLDVSGEVRFLLNHRQDLAPDSILRMATLSGAEALQSLGAGQLQRSASGGVLLWPTSASEIDLLWRDLAANHPWHSMDL